MCSFSNKVWQNPNKAFEAKKKMILKAEKPAIPDKLYETLLNRPTIRIIYIINTKVKMT